MCKPKGVELLCGTVSRKNFKGITERVLRGVYQDSDGYHHHPTVTDSSTHLGAMGDTSVDEQGQRGAPRVPVKLEAYGRPSLVPGLSHPVSSTVRMAGVGAPQVQLADKRWSGPFSFYYGCYPPTCLVSLPEVLQKLTALPSQTRSWPVRSTCDYVSLPPVLKVASGKV